MVPGDRREMGKPGERTSHSMVAEMVGEGEGGEGEEEGAEERAEEGDRDRCIDVPLNELGPICM